MVEELDIKEPKEILEDDGSFATNIGEVPDEERQSLVEELFATHKRVFNLINAWSGNNKEDSIAGRKFLNQQYAALIGVINTTNAFTKRGGDECRDILYRANKAFILSMVNEPTIKRTSYHSLFFTHWHCIELFLGLPRNGHGSRVLKDVASGLHTQDPDEKIESGIGAMFNRSKK